MMSGVNAITRFFVLMLDKQLVITAMLQEREQLQGLKAYIAATFFASNTSKSKLYRTSSLFYYSKISLSHHLQ